MGSTPLVPKDLWVDQNNPIRVDDVLSQLAHFLDQLGYSKTVTALTKEAAKKDVVVDAAEWARAIDRNTGVPLLELYELWLKKKKSLPSKANEEEEESASSGSDSDSESSSADSSDESMADAGALVDVEAEETSNDESDAGSESSSISSSEQDTASKNKTKRKRVLTPSSDESDGESSADEKPITKRAKTKPTKAASDSSSSASDSSSSGSSSSDTSESADSDSSSSESSSESSSSDSSDASSSDSSSESESDSEPAPPPKQEKKGKTEKSEKLPGAPAVVKVEVQPKKEKRVKKEAPTDAAPSTSSSATLDVESASEATENVQESSIHPSRLAQVPVYDLAAATRKQIAAEGKREIIPFSRIPADQAVDPRFASNAYVSYDYADRAHRDLVVTKGKGFTKEKNKKKRGAYRGGAIDLTPKGIKFDD